MQIRKGESLSIGVQINNYSFDQLLASKLYIGQKEFDPVQENGILVFKLNNNDTINLGSGRHRVMLWIYDSTYGVKIPELGRIEIIPFTADEDSDLTAINTVIDITYSITFQSGEISVNSVIYNLLKGDSAFKVWQLQDGNADKTIDDYFNYLRQPALDAAGVSDAATAASIIATTNAENAATLAGQKATLADQKATLADQKATLANEKAELANSKAQAADTATNNANNAEGLRATAEGGRTTAEGNRVTAESNRVSAEQGRVSAENSRVSAESTRGSNEATRISQESSRVAAEAARVAAGAEIQTNKTGDVSGNSTSTTKYPTIKGLFDWVYSLFARKSCELSPVANTYLLFDYVNSHWQVTIPDGVKIVLKDADRLTASGIAVCVLTDNAINYLYYNRDENTMVASVNPVTKQPSTCYYFGSINTYTGAETINVNAPLYKINGVLTGSNIGSKKDNTGGIVGLTDLKINFKNVANTFISFLTNENTASRTYKFPDKTGTVGMNEDILMRAKNRAYILPSANTVAGSLSINSITSPITGFQLSVPADIRVALDGYESRIITAATSINVPIDAIYAFFIRKSNSALVSVKLDGTAANMTAALVDSDLYLIGYFNPFTMPTSIVMFTPIYTYNGEYYGSGALKVNPSAITTINNTLTTINNTLSKYDYLLSGRQILNPALQRKSTSEMTKILFIGSSFMLYTSKMVRDAALASGLPIQVGDIYHSAISLELLVTAFNSGVMTGYEYHYYDEIGSSVVIKTPSTNPAIQTIKDILQSKEWDIIVIQQDANNSLLWTTFQPHLTNFISLLKQNATNPNVVMAINQTWAMNHDVYNMGFVNESDAWKAIFDNYRMASYQSGIDLIIPCASAQRSMRTTSLNGASGTAISRLHNLTCDDQHPDLGIGVYLNACTVFEAIFKQIYNVSVLGNTYRNATSNSTLGSLTTPITNDNASIAQKCAIAACANRFGYTDFTGVI